MQLSATHRLGGIASPATSSNRCLPAAARLAAITPRLLKPACRVDQWPATPARQTAVSGLFGNKGDPVPELTPDSPEQVMLRSTAGLQRTLGAIAFWVQLALSLSAAFILLFSVAFTSPAARNSDVTKWLTLIGVATAFLSTFFAHGFRTLAKKLQDGGVVARGWLVSNALGNNTLNLIGIFALVIGLQASVGTLVAKTLLTSAQTPFVGQQGSMLVSLDVFSLQASTNSLLSHVISLIYTNVLLGLVNKTLPKDATTVPSEVDN